MGKAGRRLRGGRCLEVMVESLEGISMVDESDILHAREGFAPQVTATVAFSGSCDMMEVGSSSVCGRTGHLLVESEPLQVDQHAHFSPSPCWLRASWRERDLLQQPHLRLQLPRNILPKAALSQTNRDSVVVVQQRASTALGDVDTLTTASDVTTSTSCSGDSHGYHGPTMVWTKSSAAVLPEIVELSVRLKSPSANFVEQFGVCYLVVFGNEEEECASMELPVKQPRTSQEGRLARCIAASSQPSLGLTHARLKVLVRLTTPKAPVAGVFNTSLETATTSSETLTRDQSHNDSFNPPSPERFSIGPLLARLHESEREAMEQCEAQKRAMEIEVPAHYMDGARPNYFCHLPSWNQLRRTMSFFQCDTHLVRRRNEEASGDSTISSHDSLYNT